MKEPETKEVVAQAEEKNSKFDLIPCAHCKGTGTCSSGEDGASCAVCIEANKLNKDKEYKGIVCRVCRGKGQVELLSVRLSKRAAPLLAIFIVYLALLWLIMADFCGSSNFDKILAFCGTLIGSITGYYFGGKGKK